jgi:hypothetical protein
VWGSSKDMYRDKDSNKSQSINAIDMRPPCYDRDGAHWMTREAARYGVEGNKRIFHPSIGIHMLRAEIMVYNYLAAVLDAIDMIEQDMKNLSPHENSKRMSLDLLL